jgi:hypothetical protein
MHYVSIWVFPDFLDTLYSTNIYLDDFIKFYYNIGVH